VLNREFTAEKPNEKWVTDVTEFKYGSPKKAYLSAILDLYDGSIISYVIGHSNNNNLVFKTNYQATKFLIGNKPLIHSNRGFQHTSHGFKRRINKAEMPKACLVLGDALIMDQWNLFGENSNVRSIIYINTTRLGTFNYGR
jgi:putative transposase